jgi:ubiquinone biosynthesis protein COQ9
MKPESRTARASKAHPAEAEARRDADRERLLDATLAHIPFDGWSPISLDSGAADCGLGGQTARLFPGGLAEVAAFYSARLDRLTLAAAAKADLAALKVRERVAAVVRMRLELMAGEREAVRRLVSFLALPPNARLGVRLTLNASDTLWRAIGDRSADFSYYTKRAILAGVYSSTVLFWLADRSDDSADTWAFLDRRIADVLKIMPRLNPGRWLSRLPVIGAAFAGDPAPRRP